MPRTLTPKAYEAKAGMPVRAQRFDTPDIDHVITAVNIQSDGRFLVTTNFGSWTFAPSEDVSFPRRPDNSIVVWTDPPLPTELFIGDILPSAQPDPRLDPILSHLPHIDDLVAEWQNARQVVVSVYPRKRPHVFGITVRQTHPYVGIMRYDFADFQPVEFPYTGCAITGRTSQIARPRQNRKYRAYGPYTDSVNAPQTTYFFAEHPTGVGRWPRELEYGFDIGQGVRIVKADARTFENGAYTYRGANEYDRHPKDPKFGEPGYLTEDVTCLAACVAYEQYRREGEKYEGDLEAEALKQERMG